MPVEVTQTPVQSFATLEKAWRGLERRATHSFFQSWTWVGCLAEERFTDPVLLQAERGGLVVGLALFNRRRGRLCLAESGDAALDRPFTEHNGPLAADAETSVALLRAAWRVPGARRLVLGGVAPELAASAGGVALRHERRLAPYMDLQALRASGSDPLAAISGNTRYQIRRSDRHYAGAGQLDLTRAATPAQREAFLAELIRLHEATWRRRGQPGAFATGYLRQFHEALTERAMARDELDLLRMTGPAGTVGLLYNVRHAQRVYAYQSGFADAAGSPHAKPGLSCHARAIAHALQRGDVAYDFLAGDQRYKTSLSNGSVDLVWSERGKPFSPAALAARLRAWCGARGA